MLLDINRSTFYWFLKNSVDGYEINRVNYAGEMRLKIASK
jgi:hypothetical protein